MAQIPLHFLSALRRSASSAPVGLVATLKEQGALDGSCPWPCCSTSALCGGSPPWGSAQKPGMFAISGGGGSPPCGASPGAGSPPLGKEADGESPPWGMTLSGGSPPWGTNLDPSQRSPADGGAKPISNAYFAPSHVRWGESSEEQALVVGIGYHPDLPDGRDLQMWTPRADKAITKAFALAHAPIPPLLLTTTGKKPAKTKPDGKPVDLIAQHNLADVWPVEDQRQLNSCTAHAVVGLVEYLVRVQHTDSLDLSRLFLYNTTRRLMGWSGDRGATIRDTIRALAAFGVPPEEFWPYDPGHFDADPKSFVFAYATSYKALTYFRLDGYDAGSHRLAMSAGRATLERLKIMLDAGYPVAFGFPVYTCIRDSRPEIPNPSPLDRLVGGHAVLAVGYDPKRNSVKIRNSWGSSWGDNGYGWLPYEYFENELAVDLWTVFHQSWLA